MAFVGSNAKDRSFRRLTAIPFNEAELPWSPIQWFVPAFAVHHYRFTSWKPILRSLNGIAFNGEPKGSKCPGTDAYGLPLKLNKMADEIARDSKRMGF